MKLETEERRRTTSMMNKVRRLQRELDVRGRDLEVEEQDEEQEAAGYAAGNFCILRLL